MANRYFQYYQPNKKDLKDELGDCVVRALTKAYNMEWVDVFEALLPYAREFQCMPNQNKCYEAYINANGGKWIGCKASKGTKRPTPKTFARDHSTGTYILRLAHHLVTVQDGKYFDTWDSGDRSVYGYWEV